jgi:DTW domain-containing protein
VKLPDYLKKRRQFLETIPKPRVYCSACGFSLKTCYCAQIKIFDPGITFAILIHQLEIERKIATGRMAHLALENSLLLKGHDYSEHSTINELIANPQHQCVVLFPGQNSINLSRLSLNEKNNLFPDNKKLIIFVVDGTWSTARQTMHLSKNLKTLPRISFEPSHPSNFRIRKQPQSEYLSTIEAIHETIELLGDIKGLEQQNRPHDKLLQVFNYMVEKQLSFQNQ